MRTRMGRRTLVGFLRGLGAGTLDALGHVVGGVPVGHVFCQSKFIHTREGQGLASGDILNGLHCESGYVEGE